MVKISPPVGLGAVFKKELSDHLTGKRFIIFFTLILITSLASIYVAGMTIRETAAAAKNEFVFLLLFTSGESSLPSFLAFLGFLAPLAGLALGFDSINGEYNRGTLIRLLAQPIHRDSVINGKFLAGVAVISIMLVALVLLVAGMGILLLGVFPTGEEMARMLVFIILSIIYVSFWMGLSILFSILFRQTTTSALAGMAAWLFFTIFVSIIAGVVADALLPLPQEATAAEIMRHQTLEQYLQRLSPTTLYYEATTVVLTPQARTLGPVYITQLEGAIPSSLPLEISVSLIWPHIVGLVALTFVCFAFSYAIFMRQEIRAV
ncbi:ABC transporter permease [Calderihabitans maritimus]|uniref:ABC transporter permease n=1 Tax=Calderihabitans maritimus TaxID=1246530 RepID=A0A1Z5HW10_9FIRM|nr:ABC transporter permease subunit [Calderihabitans maritimus]GAW93511.1 hypothetical protein KKC1_26420 [Calderihabitans maritimus]